MNNIYYINKEGKQVQLKRYYCKDEFSELHRMLESNHDLIPGDQISPDDPRRWLLIKREMPVPDPGTGLDRWSIDFFFVDQDGIPTFVECKRFKDTRSRREVVAQVLEYAANGHYYWDKSMIIKHAEETCENMDSNLNALLSNLTKQEDIDVEGFFENVEFKLKEGNIRLIFFLEEAPIQLKSLVEFLNKQMTRTEVILVECKMYKQSDGLVLVPSLFGYTDEARVLKQEVNTISGRFGRNRWTKESFFKRLEEQIDSDKFESIKMFVEELGLYDVKFKYGTGRVFGSIGVAFHNISSRSVFTLWSDGRIQFQFGWLNVSEKAINFRDEIASKVREIGLEIPDNIENVYPDFQSDLWVCKAKSLIDIFEKYLNKNDD